MRTPQIDDNRSCWVADAPPYRPGSALARDVDADVAIIGGGLTGISTAWHLSERFPDRRVVVLEARALANGASGRNGGQVLNWINGVEPDDPERARRIHETTNAGIDLVEALASRSKLDAGFARGGCLEICTTAHSAEIAHRRTDELRQWGIEARWLSAAECGIAGSHGAVLDPRAARVNSAALVRGLREPLLARGVEIHEGTPVTRIEEGATITLTAAGRTVRARSLVLATNGYTPSLGYFGAGILPLHARVAATPKLSPEEWAALGWTGHSGFSDDLDRISYCARTPEGRLLFGGGSNAAYSYVYGGRTSLGDEPASAFTTVEQKMRGYFPRLAGVLDGRPPVEQRWSGLLGITLDRICTMGVRGEHRNVYFALGYSGHGLALAALAGQVIADLYAGNHDAWRDLPFYQHEPAWLPPEPLRWSGYRIYTALTGRSPRRRG